MQTSGPNSPNPGLSGALPGYGPWLGSPANPNSPNNLIHKKVLSQVRPKAGRPLLPEQSKQTQIQKNFSQIRPCSGTATTAFGRVYKRPNNHHRPCPLQHPIRMTNPHRDDSEEALMTSRITPPGAIYSLADMKCYEVTYPGFNGDPVPAYVARPADEDPAPRRHHRPRRPRL